MEQTRYCPDHPDLKVAPYSEECMECNKPLQYRRSATEKPAPPVVEELENTVYDRRIDIPKEEDPRTKTEKLRDQWNVEEEKETVMRRVAEMNEPEPPKATFKELHEAVTAKIAEKKKAKQVAAKTHHKGKK